SLRASIAALKSNLNTNAAAAARALYERSLARSPRDHRLRENFAEFLESIGDLPRACSEWRKVAELLPHHHLGYFQTGRLLALQRKDPEAKTNLSYALKLQPGLSEGWM